mmetsp:Transcript_11848/g.28429  ORF Transcript_11848/g.28429 Transcript_11848/m.28429 type:complete len:148 (+) Transcript_11848:746-1189(+)
MCHRQLTDAVMTAMQVEGKMTIEVTGGTTDPHDVAVYTGFRHDDPLQIVPYEDVTKCHLDVKGLFSCIFRHVAAGMQVPGTEDHVGDVVLHPGKFPYILCHMDIHFGAHYRARLCQPSKSIERALACQFECLQQQHVGPKRGKDYLF